MLLAAFQLSCFNRNLTIYYDTYSRTVTLNAWFSESLRDEQLSVCKQLDYSHFFPRVYIGSATFSTTQTLYSLTQPLVLYLTCEGADYTDPTNACSNVESYSAAIFEFEFPDFPLTLTDTVSYYYIDLFNHYSCLHDMRVKYDFRQYLMTFTSYASYCQFTINGTITAGLVDRDLNILHYGLTTPVNVVGTVIGMDQLTYGELKCSDSDASCKEVFSAVVEDNFRNELVYIFLPTDLVYDGQIVQKDVSLLLTIESIDPTSPISCFSYLSVEIMDEALKLHFYFVPNCSQILETPINGLSINSFVETINIYIAEKRLTLVFTLPELELDKTELIQSCEIFENPQECSETLRLAISNDYQTYFTVKYMHDQQMLDSFIYTSASYQRLCFYYPTFTLQEKPCVSLRATGACVSEETYSTLFTMKLRNVQSSKVFYMESHINYPNKEENYCFVLEEDDMDYLMRMLADSSNLEADLYIGSVYYLITNVINDAPLVTYRWTWVVMACAFVCALICALVLWRLKVFNLPVLKQDGYQE